MLYFTIHCQAFSSELVRQPRFPKGLLDLFNNPVGYCGLKSVTSPAIEVSTEHITEEELNTLVSYSTYFSNALYTTYYKWTENDSINIANGEQFELMKNSLLMIGRSQDYFEHYQYYSGFSFDDIVIIFIFSDVIKNPRSRAAGY
jgi:hypothetical protein